MPEPLPTREVLVPPKSIAARWDTAMLSARPGCEVRACALALGLCWPRFLRRHPYSGDALAYSTHVLDTLAAEGYGLAEIIAAGEVAIEIVADNLPQVAPEGFTSAPPSPTGASVGGSTSDST